jgi:IS30 family transposase
MVVCTKKNEIEERRRKVAKSLAMAMTEQEIANTLGLSRATVSNDVRFMKTFQGFIRDLAKTGLAFYFNQCLTGIDELDRLAWHLLSQVQQQQQQSILSPPPLAAQFSML